jgi:hypothetical protein
MVGQASSLSGLGRMGILPLIPVGRASSPSIIAIAKSFVRLFNDFSRVRIGNMIYPGHGSVPEHAQPGKCLFG